ESFYIKQILNSEESFTIVNVDAIKTIQSEGRGGLILAAHIGNWEILGAWIAKNFNRPFTVFGRLIDNPGLQKALGDIRSGYGVKVLSKNDKAAGISVIRSLRKKEFVGAVIDQDTNVKSEMINFFGIKANTPSALVKTAQKGNYPIYAFFLIRTAPLTYSIFTHIIDSNKSTEDVLNEYNNILESLIKKYPEQWVWVHKRWRTLESLERLNSKQYINYLNRMIG
ncbi:MAG: lysophospholipid acyltransferase family protein, partial [bacterium]|nr:lysophospholipid acyltransferase family protein [bacterium]